MNSSQSTQSDKTGCPSGTSLLSQQPSYEYRSQVEFLGLPLLHITRGINPETGFFRIARGWLALGDFAIGGIAAGGISLGLISIGGISLGTITIGGLAIGMIANGAIAVGMLSAFGAIAVSPFFSHGILSFDLTRSMLAGLASNLFRTLIS
jgi:hypothetical protein